jgi:hypothetical protein
MRLKLLSWFTSHVNNASTDLNYFTTTAHVNLAFSSAPLLQLSKLCGVCLLHFSYQEAGQHEEAVRDYEKIVKMDKSRGRLI